MNKKEEIEGHALWLIMPLQWHEFPPRTEISSCRSFPNNIAHFKQLYGLVRSSPWMKFKTVQ